MINLKVKVTVHSPGMQYIESLLSYSECVLNRNLLHGVCFNLIRHLRQLKNVPRYPSPKWERVRVRDEKTSS